MKIKEITVSDIEFVVEYCKHESEPSTWGYPGAPESFEVFGIYVEDVNVYDVLCDSVINLIIQKL